jgi:hypothetical protein
MTSEASRISAVKPFSVKLDASVQLRGGTSPGPDPQRRQPDHGQGCRLHGRALASGWLQTTNALGPEGLKSAVSPDLCDFEAAALLRGYTAVDDSIARTLVTK